MKIFTQKGIINKLILILIIIILFNALIPTNVSYAESDVGGILLKPVADFMLAIGDFIMDLIHNVLYGMDTAVVRVDKDNGIREALSIAFWALVTIAVVAFVGAGALWAGAAIATALGGTGITATAIGTVICVSLGSGVAAGVFVRSELFANEYVLPIYRVTPEEIFSGKIRLLNINFFNEPEASGDDIDTTVAIQNATTIDSKTYTYDESMPFSGTNHDEAKTLINQLLHEHGYTGEDIEIWSNISKRWGDKDSAYQGSLTSTKNTNYTTGTTSYTWEIVISKGEWMSAETNTLGMQLRPTIAKWYYGIRNFALVAMMVILLYIGIRMMLTSVSSEKAKYKNMMMDWVIGICLIFVMHYIMALSMNIVDGFIKIFDSVNNDLDYVIDYEYDKKIIDALNGAGVDTSGLVTGEGDNKIIVWNARNIVGIARVNAALNNSGTYVYIGYTMCYLVLVCYTVFFLFTYMKRALYITFFTIIAPLVAMTYPIDKLHDGKAQAFDMWIKEYIFNLMIQPVHLLLYTVLISSAFELATENILYMLVAIGFMMPAEKFLRKMFGFDKAQTPGFLSGATGTALMVSAFNKLLHPKPPKGSGSGAGDGGKGNKDSSASEQIHKDGSDPRTLMQGIGGDDAEETINKPPAGSPMLYTQEEKEKQEQERRRQQQMREIARQQQNAVDFSAGHDWRIRNSIVNGLEGRNPLEEPRKITPHVSDKMKEKRSANIIAKKNEKFGKLKRKISGAAAASKSYARGRLARTASNVASGKPIKDLARFTAGAYLGLSGAALGATFALADDEPLKKMQQYVPTLAAGGAALGSRDFNVDTDEVEKAREEYRRKQYETDKEYKEAMLKEQREKIMSDEENLRKVRENLGQQYGISTLGDAQTFMNKYSNFIDAGYDMDDFCTMAKLVEDGKMDKTMAETTAKYYQKAGGKPKNMPQDSKEMKKIKHICTNIAKSSGLTDQKEIDNAVKIMFNNLNVYGDTKDSFKEL